MYVSCNINKFIHDDIRFFFSIYAVRVNDFTYIFFKYNFNVIFFLSKSYFEKIQKDVIFS